MNKKFLCGLLVLAMVFAFAVPSIKNVSAGTKDNGTYKAYIEIATPAGKLVAGNGTVMRDGVERPYARVTVNGVAYDVPWNRVLIKYQ